jgi:hypothetical protein
VRRGGGSRCTFNVSPPRLPLAYPFLDRLEVVDGRPDVERKDGVAVPVVLEVVIVLVAPPTCRAVTLNLSPLGDVRTTLPRSYTSLDLGRAKRRGCRPGRPRGGNSRSRLNSGDRVSARSKERRAGSARPGTRHHPVRSRACVCRRSGEKGRRFEASRSSTAGRTSSEKTGLPSRSSSRW